MNTSTDSNSGENTGSFINGAGKGVNTVRYSLMELLREVEIERQNSDLGRQKVDQAEIHKMFKKKRRKSGRTRQKQIL